MGASGTSDSCRSGLPIRHPDGPGVFAYRQCHQIILQRREGDPAIGNAAGHSALRHVAFAAFIVGIGTQAFPVEAAADQHVPAVGRESDQEAVEILPVVEIDAAHKLLVVGIEAGLGAVQQLKDTGAPQGIDIDAENDRVILRQPCDRPAVVSGLPRYQMNPPTAPMQSSATSTISNRARCFGSTVAG